MNDPSVTPKRVRLTAEARTEQLLDVAESLFTQHGLDGVSIEDIARAAGVTRPTVYQHYPSKEAAFLACVRRARAQFDEMIKTRSAAAGDSMTERLTTGGAAYFELIAHDRRRWALLFTTSASLDSSLADALSEYREATVATIADLVRPFAPDATEEALGAFAHVISGIGEQLGRWWLSNPRVPRRAVVEYYVAAIEGAAGRLLELPRVQRRRRPTASGSPSRPT